MNLSPIIERIRERVPAARQVRFAFSAAQANEDCMAQQRGQVFVYVVPGQRSAGPNQLASGAVHQAETVEFSVLVFAKNARDRRGDASHDELHAVLDPVRRVLHGWQPPECDRPIEVTSASPAGMNDLVSVYEQRFLTEVAVRTVEAA